MKGTEEILFCQFGLDVIIIHIIAGNIHLPGKVHRQKTRMLGQHFTNFHSTQS